MFNQSSNNSLILIENLDNTPSGASLSTIVLTFTRVYSDYTAVRVDVKAREEREGPAKA